ASGFVLVAGPAVLSSFNENWRLLWLLGDGPSPAEGALDGTRQLGLLLAAVYFLVVVAVCAGVFRRRRGATCGYNAEPAVVEAALVEACERLGLAPIRSGELFVFGLSLEAPAHRHPEGIQAPHVLPRLGGKASVTVAEELGGQSAILEVEAFAAMKHVTLRW